MILGQNSADVSQRAREIWDLSIKMRLTLFPIIHGFVNFGDSTVIDSE
jgi:hypothetical protein